MPVKLLIDECLPGGMDLDLQRELFQVALAGAGLMTDGVVLCNQVRTVDWKARRAQFVEAVPPALVAEALARVAALID